MADVVGLLYEDGLREANAKIAELSAALEPFASIGLWRDAYPDAKHDELTSRQMQGFIKVEHVRAARKALGVANLSPRHS
jgi:hypothetical protein